MRYVPLYWALSYVLCASLMATLYALYAYILGYTLLFLIS